MILLTFALIAGLSCTPASDEETVLNNEVVFVENFKNGVFPTSDYTFSYDTTISSTDPTNNYGAYSYLTVSNDSAYLRSLIMYNFIGYFPANINVKKATLTLYVSTIDSNINISFYKLTKLWVEAQATWNIYSTGNTWSTAGGDFGSAIASYTINVSLDDCFISFDLPGSLIKDWIVNPGENYGVLIKMTNESAADNSISFTSCENATTGYRPMLTIYYTI